MPLQLDTDSKTVDFYYGAVTENSVCFVSEPSTYGFRSSNVSQQTDKGKTEQEGEAAERRQAANLQPLSAAGKQLLSPRAAAQRAVCSVKI